MFAKQILTIAATATFALTLGGPASSHEYGPCQETGYTDVDGNPHDQYPPGYQRGFDATGVNDVDAEPVAYVFAHTGQYGVRNDLGYLEIRGGTGTGHQDGPPVPSAPEQGGYAQGEIDPGSGVPMLDAHLGLYGDGYSETCVAAGGQILVANAGYGPAGPVPD